MKRSFSIRVVLVRSLYERNIGAVSRAMSNMGIDQLILIAPQCEITYEAQQAAATGQTGLQERIVYSSWDEFYQKEPDSIRIAFTARDGKGRTVQDLREVYNYIRDEAPQFKHESDQPVFVHLIFGPEDWGLSNEDTALVNYCACIPTFGDNWSLNLAQAALIAMYDLRRSWGGKRTILDGQQKARITDLNQAPVFPEKALYTWLSEMGFDLSKRRINVFTVMRRMLLSNAPTRKELVILETVLQQSIRKLREWKELQHLKNK